MEQYDAIAEFWERTRRAWSQGVLDEYDPKHREKAKPDQHLHVFMQNLCVVVARRALLRLKPWPTEILYDHLSSYMLLTNYRLVILDKPRDELGVYELVDIADIEVSGWWNNRVVIKTTNGSRHTYEKLSFVLDDRLLSLALTRARKEGRVPEEDRSQAAYARPGAPATEASHVTDAEKRRWLGETPMQWRNVIVKVGRHPITFTSEYVEYQNRVIQYIDVSQVDYGFSWTGIGLLPVIAAQGSSVEITDDEGRKIALEGYNWSVLTIAHGSNRSIRHEIVPLIQERILPVLIRKYAEMIVRSTKHPIMVTETLPLLSNMGIHWEDALIEWNDLVAVKTRAPKSIYQYRHDTSLRTFFYTRTDCPARTTTDVAQLPEEAARLVTLSPEGGFPNQAVYMPLLVSTWKRFTKQGASLWTDDQMFTNS